MIYDISPVNRYNGNNSSKQFDFDFYIENQSQLNVFHYDSSDNKTKLTYNIDYSINEINNKNGSYITFPISGSEYSILSDSEKISLELTLPISQETQYNNSSLLNLESLEYSFDYLTRICQIQDRQLNRAIKVSEGSDITTDTLALNLNRVADISSDISTVAGISSDVTAVKNNATSITTVSGSIANVNAVGNSIANVNALKEDLTNIDAVKADLTNIDTVAGISSDVVAVASISSDVTAVKNNASDISALADDLTNVDTVAGSISDVNSIADNLTTIAAVNSNKTNIDTVAGISSDVVAVASISSDVTAVKNNASDISALADDLANISSVASDLTNIDAVADDLTNIDSASSNAALSKDWANKMDGTVDGYEYSAKYYAQQSAQGQVQANWNETDTTSKAYIQNKPVIPSAVTVDQTYDGTSSNPQSGIAIAGAGYELIAKDVSTLSTSGTITLADNTANKITAAGTVTFSLPSISDTTKFHQILVQLYMASAQTINFGTSYYFGDEAPDMSTAGYYTIIYEYDNVRSGWVVGAIQKASV